MDERRFTRGQRVRVVEQGLTPWVGTITAAKVSLESGLWYEIRRNDSGTYAVPERFVEER